MSGLLGSILGALVPTLIQTLVQTQAQQTQAQQTQAQASPTVVVPSPSPLPPPNESPSSAAAAAAAAQTSASVQDKASPTNNANPTSNDSPALSNGSSQTALTQNLASASVTSVSSGRASVLASTSALSHAENPSASSAVSTTQLFSSATSAASVSSSNVHSTSSTSNFASIETAAAPGDGYSPTSDTDPKDASKVPVAGVVVASVVGLMLMVTFIFLMFRYCKPLRRKYEAWQQRNLLGRTQHSGAYGLPKPIGSEMMGQSAQFGSNAFTGYQSHASSIEALPRIQTPTFSPMTEMRNTGFGLENRPSLAQRASPQTPERKPPSRGAVYSVFPSPSWHYNRELPLPPTPR